MTEKTKQLLDAPFEIRPCEVGYDVVTAYNSIAEGRVFVAHTDSKADAKRIARLPELYDALMDAAVQLYPDAFLANDKCRLCFKTQCKGREWIELLRKVRDGE